MTGSTDQWEQAQMDKTPKNGEQRRLLLSLRKPSVRKFVSYQFESMAHSTLTRDCISKISKRQWITALDWTCPHAGQMDLPQMCSRDWQEAHLLTQSWQVTRSLPCRGSWWGKQGSLYQMRGYLRTRTTILRFQPYISRCELIGHICLGSSDSSSFPRVSQFHFRALDGTLLRDRSVCIFEGANFPCYAFSALRLISWLTWIESRWFQVHDNMIHT